MDKDASREIRSQIRRVLWEEWDPIGVNDTPETADEYDLYIGGVYRLLAQGASGADLIAFLGGIEIGRMELVDGAGEPLMAESKSSGAVASLIKLRGCFTETV
jgi:hypothetical protein